MPRVVVAGLGDSGLLTALHLTGRLARRQGIEAVGIGSKPGLVSGQELGSRLARPAAWAEDYWVAFDRYRRLDRVRVVHGLLVGADLDARHVVVRDLAGVETREPYDLLVVATGVSNGFWRRPHLQTAAEVAADLTEAHELLGAARTVCVVGGGAAAVNTALHLAQSWPAMTVDLCFPGARALPSHHPRVWRRVEHRLRAHGVRLHHGHRARIPAGFDLDRITPGPVEWETGQPPLPADAVVWAVGRVAPHTGWLPAELLDEAGFVRVAPTLQSPVRPEVFAIGDVAATDPLRGSARNRADRLLARNLRAVVAGRRLAEYRPRRRRWGSVMGFQPDGLHVFGPRGRAFRFPAWSVRTVLQPWIVRRGIYKGIRPPR